jgi:hypothetical protein
MLSANAECHYAECFGAEKRSSLFFRSMSDEENNVSSPTPRRTQLSNWQERVDKLHLSKSGLNVIKLFTSVIYKLS